MSESQSSHSGVPQSRFPLQAKLTLAFVTVSLVCFVIAFLVFPRLYVRSKNRAIEASKPDYAAGLRTIIASRVKVATLGGTQDPGSRGKALIELSQQSAEILRRSGVIEALGGKLDSPTTAAELIDQIELIQPGMLEQVRQDLRLITYNFEEVWILPWKVHPLNERISLIYSEKTDRFFFPLIEPLDVPQVNFHGTLVLGGHINEPLTFDSGQDSQGISAALNQATGLTMASGVLLFGISEIRDLSPGLWERAQENRQEAFWEFTPESPEVVGRRYLWIPVDNVARQGELIGLFCITFETASALVVLRELAGTEVYLAFSVSALFAILFSIFVAKSITRPVSELTEGALAIADGKLDRWVKVSSRDEIGILAGTFNEMTQRLRRTLDELRDRAATIEQQNQELDRQFTELRALQNYTENILATVESAIFSVDLDGCIRGPNRATERLLGFKEGQEIEETVTDPLREKLRAAIEEGESTFSDEILVTTPENEQVQTALSITPLREGDKILGAVAVLTDLQDIKELEALVRRQERLAALGELTAGVAHEIRNPLSIIKACADILRQKFEGQPGESGLCRDIIEEVDRLSRVVTDFLSFARPNEPNRQPVHLNESIQRTVERLQRDGGMTASIEFDLAEPLPMVEVDPDQVEQILLNLIRNGVEAMRGEGRLTLRTGTTDSPSQVWIEVRDEGEGMDEETRKRLFDPFFTSKAEGTGLGLSICHRIMDSHDGSIEVVQTAPGMGTTFRVSFQTGPKAAIVR